MHNDLIPEMDRDKYRGLTTGSTFEKMLLLAYQLKFKRHRTFAEYASILNKSERQIRRDVKMLEKFFEIDYDEYGRPFILTEINEDELNVRLTKDEIQVLKNIVKNSKKKMVISIKKKLDTELAKAGGVIELDFKDTNIGARIDVIRDCINRKVKLKVLGYENLRGKKREDIILEPISISQLKYLTAFDIASRKTKNYVIMRMDGLEAMDEPMAFRGRHKRLMPDIFGMHTGEAFEVKLQLTHLSYTLLVEDFPLTKRNIIETGSKKYPYEFIGRLNGLQGIGRFVLGLPGEIKISKPKELKRYIAEKAKEY